MEGDLRQFSSAQWRLAASGLAIVAAGLAVSAQAQAPAQPAPSKSDEQTIIVTGFRTSLAAALNENVYFFLFFGFIFPNISVRIFM